MNTNALQTYSLTRLMPISVLILIEGQNLALNNYYRHGITVTVYRKTSVCTFCVSLSLQSSLYRDSTAEPVTFVLPVHN